MSSPNMNNLIIVGCMLVYCNVYLMRIDPSKASTHTYRAICTVSKILYMYIFFSVLCFEFFLEE